MSENRSSYLAWGDVYAGSCECHHVCIFCLSESASESLLFVNKITGGDDNGADHFETLARNLNISTLC